MTRALLLPPQKGMSNIQSAHYGGQNGDYKGKQRVLDTSAAWPYWALGPSWTLQRPQRHFPAELTLGSTKGLGLPKRGQDGGAGDWCGVGRLHRSAGRALSLR